MNIKLPNFINQTPKVSSFTKIKEKKISSEERKKNIRTETKEKKIETHQNIAILLWLLSVICYLFRDKFLNLL